MNGQLELEGFCNRGNQDGVFQFFISRWKEGVGQWIWRKLPWYMSKTDGLPILVPDQHALAGVYVVRDLEELTKIMMF